MSKLEHYIGDGKLLRLQECPPKDRMLCVTSDT